MTLQFRNSCRAAARASWVLSAIVGALALSMSRASAHPLEEHQAIRNEVAAAWYRNDVATLDQIGTNARTEKTLTPTGLWQLAHYYDVLQAILASSNWRYTEAGADDELLAGWQRAYPQSPAPVIVQAMLLRWRSKNARETVAKDRALLAGWQPEIEYLKQARQILEDNKQMASRDPHWYAVMIQIQHAQNMGLADIIALHQEGASAEPGYDPTHAMAMTVVAEKMPGHLDRVEQFADTVRQAVGPDRGDEAYARLYMNFYQAQFEPKNFHQSGVHYSRLKAGMARIVATYPVTWNISHAALFACLYGDHPGAADMFWKLGGPPIREIWKLPTIFAACKKMAMP